MPSTEAFAHHKTFVLGVGAQKSGTTWLHQYLSAYPCANFGLHKEYHVWDAVFSEDCQEFLVTPDMLLDSSNSVARVNDANALRYAMQNFSGVYAGYFANLVRNNHWLTGDITPAYACLHSDELRHIKDMIESVGMQIKVVFLMRDPFERCWSAVRMYKRTNDLSGSDESCLANLYASTGFRFRTLYQDTILNLEQVFSPTDIYYGFYENLFTGQSLQRLSEFLGIPPNYAAIDQLYNASPKSESCSETLKAEVRLFYRDVYDFCATRFPETRVLWQGPII